MAVIRRPLVPLTLLLAATLGFAACSRPADGPASSPAGEPTPHGYVEGAEELAEPQIRLAYYDAAAGQLAVFDTLDEKVVATAPAAAITGLYGDGRYALTASSDRPPTVIDTGSWLVDHGDHVHYYRAPAHQLTVSAAAEPIAAAAGDGHRLLTLPAAGVANATGAASQAGTVRLFSREALDAQKWEPEATLAPTSPATPGAPGAGAAPAFAAFVQDTLLFSSASDRGNRLTAGAPTASAPATEAPATQPDYAALNRALAPCTDPHSAAYTRYGTVVLCGSGVLTVKDPARPEGVRFSGFPAGQAPTPPPSTALITRPGSGVLVFLAGEHRAWTVQLSDLTLAPLELTTPATQIVATGVNDTALTLSPAGTVQLIDLATGQETARLGTEELGSSPEPSAITVTAERAYVTDPAHGRILELDYSDGLRLAREFPGLGTPTHLIHTGS